jgi:hypothetical protein
MSSTPIRNADYAITIYSAANGAIDASNWEDGQECPGYALISDTREMQLVSGRAELPFSDVASCIDPTTVSFASLTDPVGTRVLEQNYQFDLVSQIKLLNRYVGEAIAVTQSAGSERITHKGVLLGARDGLLLQTDDGILALSNYESFAFAHLPGGLITKPTLVWDIDTQTAGTHLTRVAYQTRGMTWWADYNVILSTNEAKPSMDLSVWVTLINQSGASYENAKIKLVAGDPNRVPAAARPLATMAKGMTRAALLEDGFVQTELFEYHLYTLTRRSTLPNNSSKQLALFPAKVGIPAQRQLIFSIPEFQHTHYWSEANIEQGIAGFSKGEVLAYLVFDNTETAGLGIPLPKGRVRVSQQGPDGALEFVGEDQIDHTPKNETLRLKLGKSFDVTGDRTRTHFQLDITRKTMVETYKLCIRNRKNAATHIIARETLFRWSSWSIEQSSCPHQKQSAQSIDFSINLDANSEVEISYTVRYQW